MAQRSSRQVLSMIFSLATFASGCVGSIDANDALASASGDVPAPEGSGEPALEAPVELLAAGDGGVRLHDTLRVSGRQILDTCGKPWAARGMEQITGNSFTPNNLPGLAKELIATGSNAVRLLPRISELKAADVDGLLTAFAASQVVVYLSPGDRTWFNRADIKPVLLKHEKGIVLDAFQEPDYNDVPRWIKETKAAIAQVRGYGYKAPLTVLANQYGRDLSAALEHGGEVAASDPQHNIIIGWQAYWGQKGWYQKAHGMSLTQGVETSAERTFPMQLGIDLNADANEPMDYSAVMAAAEEEGMSWLWWNFWNRWDSMGNNASTDGTAKNLTAAGRAVVETDPNSIKRTAKKACFR